MTVHGLCPPGTAIPGVAVPAPAVRRVGLPAAAAGVPVPGTAVLGGALPRTHPPAPVPHSRVVGLVRTGVRRGRAVRRLAPRADHRAPDLPRCRTGPALPGPGCAGVRPAGMGEAGEPGIGGRGVGQDRRCHELVVGDVGTEPAFDPAVRAGVEQRQAADRLGRRGHHDHLVGPVAGPGGAAGAHATARLLGWSQRIAAGAPHPGQAPVVDQDGGAGLEHGLVSGRLSVAVAVVGDAGVGAQQHRGEGAQVAGQGGAGDAGRPGEGLAARRVRGQPADLPFDVADGDADAAAVEPGGAAGQGVCRRQRGDGESGGRGADIGRAAGAGRPGDAAAGGAGRRGLGEGVGPLFHGGLEEDLLAQLGLFDGGARTPGEEQRHRQQHAGHGQGSGGYAHRALRITVGELPLLFALHPFGWQLGGIGARETRRPWTGSPHPTTG
ncbi:hypothetical protein STEPF1_04628 [Streptomyces sp. F-1]|nr:hypothetical protein STEPF1_04628 [Streptomyces sp. F-1]